MKPERDTVADELAIRDLVHRYADAASRRDPAELARTFTADGEWRAERLGRHRGREAMTPFFASMLEGWDAFVQGLLSGRIALDGDDPDRARGRWYVIELGKRTGGEAISVTGVYHDAYRRDAGTWRIELRRYDPLLSQRGDAVTTTPFPADVSGPLR